MKAITGSAINSLVALLTGLVLMGEFDEHPWWFAALTSAMIAGYVWYQGSGWSLRPGRGAARQEAPEKDDP
ncbi:hypothetical protein [Methylobacterium nigriterrae]|uniref:hypothetical protein n=1 Tax=Methylobacterium nigriterrae TaxID=3127512 RepID=UPI003013CAA7